MTEPKFPGGVGYAKPPKSGQFKKGQSGNPKGRGTKSAALATIIRKSAKERVVVQENGTRKSITKGEAAIKQLFNKATSGDQRAIKLMLDLPNSHEAAAEPAGPQYTMGEADREVLAQMIGRAQWRTAGGNDAQ